MKVDLRARMREEKNKKKNNLCRGVELDHVNNPLKSINPLKDPESS